MDGIGQRRSKRDLLESILKPSRLIEKKYRSHQVLTIDGKLATGLLVRDTDSEVILCSADGQNHRIEKVDVDSRQIQSESLMPTGLIAELTAQEVADLLAFLVSLR